MIDAENSQRPRAAGPPFEVEAFAVEAVSSDGIELEAEAAWPGRAGADGSSSGATADAVVVLSHPHPLYGGDMWNPLVDHLFRALPASGIAALRYNFRGTGTSGGSHDGLAAWIGIAAPLRIVDPASMGAAADPRPKLLLVPEHDQFRSPAEAAEITEGWTNTRLEVISGGDHFLMGHARVVGEKIASFVSGLP